MSDKDPHTKNPEEKQTFENGLNVVDIGEHRLRRQLPYIFPAFEAWCYETRFDVQGDKLRARITRFLGSYARLSGSKNVTFFEIPAFEATLDELMQNEEINHALELSHVFGAYLEFIHSTGRWHGTHKEYVELLSFFHNYPMPRFQPGYSPIPELQAAIITVPKLAEEEFFTVLSALPVVRRLRTFLLWFGDKREISSGKWLSKKYVQEAAATLDIDAAPLIGAVPWPRKPGPMLFRNASDISRLKLYWDAMVAAKLIRLTATRAYITKLGSNFLNDPQTNFVEVVHKVARDMYRSFCVEDDAGYQEPELGYLTRYFLLKAAVKPISVKVLKYPVRGLDDFDPRGDRYVIKIAWDRLECLQDEGLVSIKGKLRIPPALLKPLVRELAPESEVEYQYTDPADEEEELSIRPWV